MSGSTLNIEVAYARPDTQVVLSLTVPLGATVETAIKQSGILDQFSEIKLNNYNVGIFGERADLQTVLESGDRVEIYRPLQIDPKQARKHRAALAKDKKKM